MQVEDSVLFATKINELSSSRSCLRVKPDKSQACCVCTHREDKTKKKKRLNVRTMIIITKVIDCLGLFTLNRHESERQKFTFVAECFHRNCEEKFVRDEIFTGVCLSTGEGACMVGGLVCVAGGGGRAWQGVCMAGVCVCGGVSMGGMCGGALYMAGGMSGGGPCGRG